MRINLSLVHGYSLLRTQLNKDYFNDIFDVATQFDVKVESHREVSYSHSHITCPDLFPRHRDWSWRVRDSARLHQRSSDGRQRHPLQVPCQERRHEAWHPAKLHGKTLGKRMSVSSLLDTWTRPLSFRDSFQGAAGTPSRHSPSNFLLTTTSHVHVSLKSKEGRNVFAVSDADLARGRADAAFEDTKWLSKEGEWFLAGVLDGLADVVPLVRDSLPDGRSVILIRLTSSVRSHHQRVQAASRRRGESERRPPPPLTDTDTRTRTHTDARLPCLASRSGPRTP
jgi:glutamine synthetase